MTKYVQRGETIDYTNASASKIAAGEVVKLTNLIGIASTDIPVGSVGALNVIGVYDIPAVNTEAFTVGQAVYFKDGKVQSNETDAVPAGWVISPKATAGTVARVKIG
ncbi:DUF2190 family protein [Psychrobacillus sp. FSL K6-1267]|uniref:DUF2190 family protein n=1 Tax=Psychrobacillus sp. FSL K6-1267 TaxID=2921543 RepID=UPI0030FC8BA8